MSTSSLYELLGVQADADAAAIKRARIAAARSTSPNLTRRADCAADSRQLQAYLKAARDTHPDKNGGDEAATERFQQVGRAYAVLSDAEKRKLYDETGMVDDGARSRRHSHATLCRPATARRHHCHRPPHRRNHDAHRFRHRATAAADSASPPPPPASAFPVAAGSGGGGDASYWREAFERVSLEKLDALAASYRHTEEEAADLRAHYIAAKGDMGKVITRH